MTDTELHALVVLVERETAIMDMQFKQYGEMQSDPVTPASCALDAELRRRGVIP